LPTLAHLMQGSKSISPHMKSTIMPAAVKASKREIARVEPDEDSFAEGIIKGLQDFKEGRVTRFKNAEEMADYLRNL